MKRAILPALMIALLCACGSTGETETKFTQWREDISSVELCAVVTTTQGDSAAEYELSCSYSPETCTVEIIAPESLAGVTASRSGDETELEYDGLILSLGAMDGITPINALPELLDAIINGHLELSYEEPDGDDTLIAAELTLGDTVTVRLWLEPEQMTPLRAAFESDGNGDIKAEITKWNIR
ncbi:MAG: hypothetical protein AB7D36_10315 [Oscillospiraceae bacterium]